MSRVAIYIVVGFLGSGKTRWLAQQVEADTQWPAVIQFEQGRYRLPETVSKLLSVPDEMAPHSAWEATAKAIATWVSARNADTLWVEWNGMQEFALLERLLYDTSLAEWTEVKRVWYVTTVAYMQHAFGRTGDANLSQLAAADAIVLGQSKEEEGWDVACKRLQRLRTTLHVGSSADPIPASSLWKGRKGQWLIATLCMALALLGWQTGRLAEIIAFTTGLFLQALPFLAMGTVLAAMIQVFVQPRYTSRLITGSLYKRYAFALFGGLFLPLCDCAVIPVFRSLLQQRLPLSIAVTFLLASPMVHPLVIFSTYYAFGGSWSMVLSRLGIGLLVALLVGLSFSRYTGSLAVASEGMMEYQFQQRLQLQGYTSQGRSWQAVLTHSNREMLWLVGYLFLACLFSAGFQIFALPLLAASPILSSMPVATMLFMIFAFVLSLCATADAMVGRALGAQVGMIPVLGFLVLGPMMDAKNMLMLARVFPRSFVFRLVGRVVLAVFVCVMLRALW